MKQYTCTIKSPIVLEKAIEIDVFQFLRECQVHGIIRKILLEEADNIYFAQSGSTYFYVMDGIPSFYC